MKKIQKIFIVRIVFFMLIFCSVTMISGCNDSGTDSTALLDFEYVMSFGSGGTGNGEFSTPEGIAIDSNGYVYVADFGNHRIQKFNIDVTTQTTTFMSTWGTEGDQDGELDRPSAITIDSSDIFYVSDRNNHRIITYNTSGVFQGAVGANGAGNCEFNYPQGLLVLSGNLYICDRYNYRIQVLDGSNAFVREWGSSGIGNGELNLPYNIDADSNSLIYVTDFSNHRIQVFNTSGMYQFQWGDLGSSTGDFNSPAGIYIDSSNRVYVSEAGNNRVQVFDTSGNFLGSFGSMGTGNGEFIGPASITMDSEGYIYVVDGGNNRVNIFKFSN